VTPSSVKGWLLMTLVDRDSGMVRIRRVANSEANTIMRAVGLERLQVNACVSTTSRNE
jgi:hypothetical protein